MGFVVEFDDRGDPEAAFGDQHKIGMALANLAARGGVEAFLGFDQVGDSDLAHDEVTVLGRFAERAVETQLAGRYHHVTGKLSDGYATFRALPKAERRRFLEDCIAVHAANRAESEAVMWARHQTPEP